MTSEPRSKAPAVPRTRNSGPFPWVIYHRLQCDRLVKLLVLTPGSGPAFVFDCFPPTYLMACSFFLGWPSNRLPTLLESVTDMSTVTGDRYRGHWFHF